MATGAYGQPFPSGQSYGQAYGQGSVSALLTIQKGGWKAACGQEWPPHGGGNGKGGTDAERLVKDATLTRISLIE